MTLDPAQAARLDGSASATSHIVKTSTHALGAVGWSGHKTSYCHICHLVGFESSYYPSMSYEFG